MLQWPDENETRFLNVDLDIYSRWSLLPLVEALGPRVRALYVGREGRKYGAHLELPSSYGKRPDADRLIREFAGIVATLPKAARKHWDRAQSREFNIGIQAGRKPHGYELRVEADTVKAVARLGARIGITTYALEEPKRKRRARRK